MICSNTEIQKYSDLRCSHSYLSEQNIGPKLKTKSLLVHVRKWVNPIFLALKIQKINYRTLFIEGMQNKHHIIKAEYFQYLSLSFTALS